MLSIVDLANIKDTGGLQTPGWHVSVLELNPFESATSACLFDWSVDGAVLRGEGPAGSNGFEMRVRRQPMPGILARAVPHVRKQLQAWVADQEAKAVAAATVSPHDTPRVFSPWSALGDNSEKDVLECRNCLLIYCASENDFCPACGSSTAITKQLLLSSWDLNLIGVPTVP